MSFPFAYEFAAREMGVTPIAPSVERSPGGRNTTQIGGNASAAYYATSRWPLPG